MNKLAAFVEGLADVLHFAFALTLLGFVALLLIALHQAVGSTVTACVVLLLLAAGRVHRQRRGAGQRK